MLKYATELTHIFYSVVGWVGNRAEKSQIWLKKLNMKLLKKVLKSFLGGWVGV